MQQQHTAAQSIMQHHKEEGTDMLRFSFLRKPGSRVISCDILHFLPFVHVPALKYLVRVRVRVCC
jgi:hypothetical protein